jgi:hypothetical protein
MRTRIVRRGERSKTWCSSISRVLGFCWGRCTVADISGTARWMVRHLNFGLNGVIIKQVCVSPWLFLISMTAVCLKRANLSAKCIHCCASDYWFSDISWVDNTANGAPLYGVPGHERPQALRVQCRLLRNDQRQLIKGRAAGAAVR